MAAPRKTFKNLSPSDKFYIAQKAKELSAEQIADDIGTSVDAVQKLLDDVAGKTEEVKADQSIVGVAITANQPFVRDDGITIMTPASAQWGDEKMKKAEDARSYIDNNKDRIFRPNPNKPSR